MPAIFLEKYEQEPATYEGGSKATKRLHAIDESFVFLPKSEYGKGIGGYILCGRCYERQEDKRDDEIEILMQVEMPNKEDYSSIYSFAYEDATAIAFHRVTSAVNHRRPQEFEHPWELY